MGAGESGEGAARADYGVEQASGGHAFAEIEAIRDDAPDAQVLGERAHDVVEALADQDDFAARGDRFVQFGDAFFFEARLQKIFEEFLAEEVEAVAADSAEDGVEEAGGEDAVGEVEEGAGEGERGHGAAAGPTLEEALRIPGEEGDGADGGEIEQAAFHAPEDGFARGCRGLLRRPG